MNHAGAAKFRFSLFLPVACPYLQLDARYCGAFRANPISLRLRLGTLPSLSNLYFAKSYDVVFVQNGPPLPYPNLLGDVLP